MVKLVDCSLKLLSFIRWPDVFAEWGEKARKFKQVARIRESYLGICKRAKFNALMSNLCFNQQSYCSTFYSNYKDWLKESQFI